MIMLGHIGTGAIIGGWFSSPASAAVAGFLSHGLFDIAPHGEIDDRPFEIASAIGTLSVLLAGRGISSPAFWGALAACLPDTEHIMPKAREGGRRFYPTHRFKSLHSSNKPRALPAWGQVIVGGAVVGALLMRGRPRPRTQPPRTDPRERIERAVRVAEGLQAVLAAKR